MKVVLRGASGERTITLKRDYSRSTLSMEIGRSRFAYNLSFPMD